MRDRTVFISYRRDGGADVARVLQSFLERHDFEVFLDVDALDSGQFDDQLLARISSSRNFVLVCTPGGLDRCQQPDDWVRRELAHAIKCGCRIIPVTLPGFTWPAKGVLPPEIAAVSDHNAFEYAHTHWKFTSTKLLKMVSSSTASRPARDTSTSTNKSATARADPLTWKQSVEDRLALARMREYREYLNGLDGSRRIDVIESALEETNELPTEELALREVACFRATIILESYLIHQGAGRFAAGALESALSELRTPAIFAAPSDEQLALIVRLERVVADHRRAARAIASGNAQGQRTPSPTSAEGTRDELRPSVADDSAEGTARADSQSPPLPPPLPIDAAGSSRPLTSPSASQTAQSPTPQGNRHSPAIHWWRSRHLYDVYGTVAFALLMIPVSRFLVALGVAVFALCCCKHLAHEMRDAIDRKRFGRAIGVILAALCALVLVFLSVITLIGLPPRFSLSDYLIGLPRDS